ncbi:MAG: YjjG family noncanonical pyrimidine nucleotidase [Oscillospiraceae bacterium]|nr:YjjG family noncanonical pyrimidine nucleotidase [Oscillospiraceae bacterium]
MIEFVFFDVDDTLLDFGWSEHTALHRTYRELGVPLTEDMYARYHCLNRLCWQACERGEITREIMLTARHRQMFQEYGIDRDPGECERRYRKNLGIGHCLTPHALEILDYLHPRYRLFLASNGVAETQYSRLDSAGLTPYFEQIFISEDAGALKPTPEYFDYCFARIPGVCRERAVLIGDSLSSDIMGGRQAGIRTIWYNPNGKAGRDDLLPDWEICDLLELTSIL